MRKISPEPLFVFLFAHYFVIDTFCDSVHFGKVLFDFFNHFELIACSDEIVFGISRPEIYVAVKIVREETDAAFICHKERRKGEGVNLGSCQSGRTT